MAQAEKAVTGDPQGKKRTPGRNNTKDIAETNPTLRWPNEVFKAGDSGGLRPKFDDITVTQFAYGFTKNIMDVQDQTVKNRMMAEMLDILAIAQWQS